jgi:hypothetical protein
VEKMKIHFTVNKNLFRKLCVVFPALIQDLVNFMTKKKKKRNGGGKADVSRIPGGIYFY